MTNSFLYDLVSQMYIYSDEQDALRDKIFDSEAAVIRSLAEKGRCVIMGRCADYVLKDRPACLKVYMHASESYQTRRIMSTEGLSEKEAQQKIVQNDRRRADNYRYYTRRIWGLAKNYDLTVDTELGEEAVTALVLTALHTL